MRQALKELNRRLKSGCFYLLALVLSYDPQPDIRAIKAFIEWLSKKPGYVVALLLLLVVVLSGCGLLYFKDREIMVLRGKISATSGQYKAELERKQQRLAAVLSHLEANPQIKTPGNHQSLIAPYAKMEWNYSTTANGIDQSNPRGSILTIQDADIILNGKRANVTGEAALTWRDSTKGNSTGPYSPKHSIIEIKNAADPLGRSKTIKARVAGEAAWYPIALSDTLGDGGTFLWRVIEGEMDASGHLRAEGSWGPYSVFTIYPSAYERIKATKKIRIGTYNVGQVKFESKDSAPDETCSKLSDISSEKDRDVLCKVIKSSSIIETFGKLTPVVKRYSDIDHKLLLDLKAGELDIAFGNISKAAYRKGTGIHFVEYSPSKPVLLTNDKKKRTEEIGRGDRICAVQGTVYEHVLGKITKKTRRRYNFVVCQNTIDAVDRLLKNDVKWIVMMGEQTWETEIEPKHGDKLYRNARSELVNSVPKEKEYEIEGDAFAITDSDLLNAICLALGKKNRDCQILVPPASQKEALPSRVKS